MSFMTEAVKEAQKAYEENEVPIGAVIVRNNKVIAAEHNRCEQLHNSTAHAEMLAINKAAELLGDKVLSDCDIYVTVEPCAMCAGAMFNTKIKRIYIGCMEPKTGFLGSVADISQILPWNPEVYYGFCEEECKELMQSFFENKR